MPPRCISCQTEVEIVREAYCRRRFDAAKLGLAGHAGEKVRRAFLQDVRLFYSFEVRVSRKDLRIELLRQLQHEGVGEAEVGRFDFTSPQNLGVQFSESTQEGPPLSADAEARFERFSSIMSAPGASGSQIKQWWDTTTAEMIESPNNGQKSRSLPKTEHGLIGGLLERQHFLLRCIIGISGDEID
jgi:hypothetical protein